MGTSNCTYEFEYFYEPADDTQPIRKLFITLDLRIDAVPVGFLSKFAIELKDLRIQDKAGLDVTKTFEFLRPHILKEFFDSHDQKAIDVYTEGM